jgi:hypothetical protein
MRDAFQIVRRPTIHRRGLKSPFCEAIRATLTTQDAVSVPINGEPYGLVSARVSQSAQYVARSLNVRARVQKSQDGLSVLVWLEPKESENGKET